MISTRKLPAIGASLALLAFATALFWPALFGGKLLAPLDITTQLLAPWKDTAAGAKPHNHYGIDAVTQYLPYRIHAARSLREDGYIGWNPYTMGGSSLAANTMALPGSWTMQLHRFLPFTEAWNVGIFAEFLIAGFGMLVFLRSRSLPWMACIIGAVAYMTNSQFVIWIYHRWALSSFCWMPWVLWSAAGGWSWKNPSVRQMLLPGFLSLALLGASLQHMVFIVLACGCILAGAIPSVTSAHKQWRVVAGWGVALLLAMGMAAFTIVPEVVAYFSNLAIGHTRGGLGYPQGISQPFFNLVAIPAQVWPWLLGDPQTIDGWRLLKSAFMDLAYLGTIPMVLALLGVFCKGMPRQAKWLILAGLLIPLTPLVGPLYHRVQLLFLLGGSWMAAELLACLPMVAPARLARWMTLAVVALGMVLLVGAGLPAKIRTPIEQRVVTAALAASTDSNFGEDKAWIEQRARNWTARFSLLHPRTAWVYGLLVVGTAGLILSTRRNAVAVRWGHVAVLGATSLELCTLFQTWSTFSNPGELLAEHPAIAKVRALAGPHRVLQTVPKARFVNLFAPPNLLSSYAIASVDAYESIQYQSSLNILGRQAPEIGLLLAGVGVLVQPANTGEVEGTGGWPVAAEVGGFLVRTNPQVPAPIVAGSGSVPLQPQDIVAALTTAIPLKPDLQTMNRWAFDVPPDHTWIRLAQNWHEGWRWRVASQDWQPCHQGSDAACWINSVPKDARRIEVRFFPRSAGLACASSGAVLAWLCLCAVARFSRRQPRL